MRRNIPEEVLEIVENDPGVSTKRIFVLTGQTMTAECIPIINNRYKNFSPRIFTKRVWLCESFNPLI